MAELYEFSRRSDAAGAITCAEVQEEHAAYVWGGLNLAHRERIDRHRRTCAACDARLLESERVISELDEAQPKIAPPSALRGRVLEAIGDARSPVQAAPSRPLVTLASRRRMGPFWGGLATGLAGAAAAAALVAVMLLRPEALGAITAPQSQLGASDQGQPPGAGLTLPLPGQAPTTSPQRRLIELRGPSDAAGRGLLAYDGDTRRGVLLLEGLPAGVVGDWGVWLVQGPQRVLLGTLSIGVGGTGAFVLPEPLPVEHPERIEAGPLASSSGAAEGVLSAPL